MSAMSRERHFYVSASLYGIALLKAECKQKICIESSLSDPKCARYNEDGGEIFCGLQGVFLGMKPPPSFELGLPGPKVMARISFLKEFSEEAVPPTSCLGGKAPETPPAVGAYGGE